MAFLAATVAGCLEDTWEPDDEFDFSHLEECDAPETYRCNGEMIEICRLANGFLAWRPLEDCSNIAGGICDASSGAVPVCTGDYWDSGYCPGSKQPASTDCGTIEEAGCCNKSGQNLYCDADGLLWCNQCWIDSYYLEVCTWDTDAGYYGCVGPDEYYYPAEIIEDPSGTYPLDCPDTP